MSTQEETAVTALRALRASVRTEPVDEALLRRVLSSRSVPGRSRRRARWPFWLGSLALTSGALAASGGFDGIRSWWLSIEGDGELVHRAPLDSGGEGFALELDDGTRVDVAVSSQADRTESGSQVERLRMSLETEGPAGTVHEETEDVFSDDPFRTVDPGLVVGARHMTTGLDADGREAHLFLVDPFGDTAHELEPALGASLEALEGTGALALVELREDGALPTAAVFGTVPAWAADERADLEVVPLESGGLELVLRLGIEREAVVLWGRRFADPPSAALDALDGRLRIRAERPASGADR